MQLTKNFSLLELTSSETATRRGIDNTPSQTEINNLKKLCEEVMQPLRDWYGKPINITSGFRSAKLNRVIGGASSSQHVKGEAIDFTLPKEDYKKVWKWITENLEYDQIIWEFGNSEAPDWIHISYTTNNRNQKLKAEKQWGVTRYISI